MTPEPQNHTPKKLATLIAVAQKVSELEAQFPPDEARRRGREYIAQLPDDEWKTLEQAVKLYTTPEGAELMGLDSAGRNRFRKLLQDARSHRKAGRKEWA